MNRAPINEEKAVVFETVRTESFSMNCFHFGRGAQALVILPGLSVQSVMGLAESVAAACGALADDFTVYVFDRRNELPPAYPVRDMARDTARAIRALGLDRVHIFGASQGGMIAMVIALENPGLVQKLVLGSTAARVDAARYQTIGKWIQLARRGDAAALYLAFGEAIYPREMFERSRALLAEAARTVTDADLERFVVLAEGMRGFDVTGEMDRIACPALVIGSHDDQVLGPDASEQLAERLNGRARLYMYDGYGHAVYDTAPDYRERMRRFLLNDEAPTD